MGTTPSISSGVVGPSSATGQTQFGNINYAAKTKGAWIPWAIGGGIVAILGIAALFVFRRP